MITAWQASRLTQRAFCELPPELERGYVERLDAYVPVDTMYVATASDRASLSLANHVLDA